VNDLPPFAYHRPDSLREACALLSEPDAVVLAGGTDLMVRWRTGRSAPSSVVSLRGLDELTGITATPDGAIRIGARVSLSELMADTTIRERCPVLIRAARFMGSPAVRHLATVGGNCCNASPAADLPPPLLVLDATVEITSADATRTVALADFFAGPGTTVLARGEILSAIILPARPGAWRTAFVRLDMRRAMDIALVSVAASLRWEGDSVVDARIALGAVAPTPLRAIAAETAVTGRSLDVGALGGAAQAAMAEATPITDARASADYRRAMVGVLTRRALQACESGHADG
jgi:carbon-monoxide dehydrogenase medium subunit